VFSGVDGAGCEGAEVGFMVSIVYKFVVWVEGGAGGVAGPVEDVLTFA
jgi:hypothetical protein